jgi:N-formylglutamate amidohydrolase
MNYLSILLAVSALFCDDSFAAESTAKPETRPHPLVTALSGDLPIILSAPHGGREAVPDVPPRLGKGVRNFQTKTDTETARLTEELVYRGTQNGKTTAHLTKRFGKEALTGGKSLFGHLAKQGFTVDPPADSPNKETHYTGGHIIATYGSAAGGTFDAIQLELGKDLRSPTQRTQTAAKMATAITAFATDYLPKNEIAGNAQNAPRLSKKIVVGVYHDEGAGPSVNDLTRTLASCQ